MQNVVEYLAHIVLNFYPTIYWFPSLEDLDIKALHHSLSYRLFFVDPLTPYTTPLNRDQVQFRMLILLHASDTP